MIETKELFYAFVFMRMFIFWNVLAVLFMIFAWVQINDPDPWMWFSLYLINAFTLMGAANQKTSTILSSAFFTACVISAYIHWPPTFDGFAGNMSQNPHIELARESAGLLLIALSQVGIIMYSVPKGKAS